MVIESCVSRACMRSDKLSISDLMQYHTRIACLALSHLTSCPGVMYDIKAKRFDLGSELLSGS